MPISKKHVDNPEIHRALADAWLNIKVDEEKLDNPLQWPEEFSENPQYYITWVMSQPEYFYFICKEIFGIELLPTQALILKEMWHRKFPMLVASRGFGKSFLMGIYALLRILLLQERKIVIAGAAFRQSKVIFEYMENIWYNAPLLRDIVGTSKSQGPKHDTDMYTFHIGRSVCRALPIGDGQKIRGQRAHDLLCDEFAAIPVDIFENVLAGFAAVSSSPLDNVKKQALIQMAKELGVWEEYEESDDAFDKDNQLIVSGTAYYDFNHFAKYWKDWKEIICTQGDPDRIKSYYKRKAQEEGRNDFEVPESFNWRDYSIIRIPFEMIPRGFMDEAQVARSRATIHAGIYEMEYGAVFSTDSNGFFKRSLIEKCVVSNNRNISFPSCGDVMFEGQLVGKPGLRYVYGIDPASEVDNFSIIILELWADHRRVVYGWTTNKEQHATEIKNGLTEEHNFYSYCSKKIRNLMRRFPCERIMLDSQGGGYAVMEALQDPDKIGDGELPIWEVIDDKKEKESDSKSGLHIVELVNFASADWTAEANHGLRKDMEDKIVIFPFFDAVTIAVSEEMDKRKRYGYDSIEDCVMEIEELKDELSTIIISSTAAGRDRWDTPAVKLPGGKKGRMRKDRYSSLVMANMGARQLVRNPKMSFESDFGGFAGGGGDTTGDLYSGNESLNEWAKEFYG